jgi:uncharacterized protein (UPF0332 family)
MAFDWREFKALAVALSRAADEASKRTAISRGYYFAYHIALSRARAHQYVRNSREPAHKQLWDHYENSSNADCVKLAQIGRRMKLQRAKADYDDVFPRLDDAVTDLLSQAEKCESMLNALPPGIP